MIDGEVRYESDMSLSELQRKIKKLTNIGINKDKTKLFDWIESWLEHHVKPYKKPSTYANYKYAYEKYISKHMKNVQMKNVKKHDVQKLIYDLNAKDLSVALIKNVRKTLSAAFESSIEEDILELNPTKGTKLPEAKQPIRKTLKIEELSIVIDKLSTSRWLYAVLFMLATGVRRGELLGLKWSNVDYSNKRILIENNLTQFGEGTPKDNDYHYAPLSDHAVLYLAGWKNQLEKEYNPALQSNADTIFVSKYGKPLKPSSFNGVFRKRNFGFKVTPHMFRHTFVYLSKGKLSLSELQEALGHDQSTTTLDIYGLMLSDTVSVADKIEQSHAELDKKLKEIQERREGKRDEKIISLIERKAMRQ
jgi:integrase